MVSRLIVHIYHQVGGWDYCCDGLGGGRTGQLSGPQEKRGQQEKRKKKERKKGSNCFSFNQIVLTLFLTKSFDPFSDPHSINELRPLFLPRFSFLCITASQNQVPEDTTYYCYRDYDCTQSGAIGVECHTVVLKKNS